MRAWGLVLAGFSIGLALRYLFAMFHEWFATKQAAVYFSPKGGCTEAIVAEIRHAHSEILVLAYSFTSRTITEALIEAHLRGVRVEIVLDHSNEKEPYTDLPHLLQQGMKPLIDPNHAIAHNKVMVIDSRTVLTGSFNFTGQAEKENAENLLILRGHPELVAEYRKNFHEHRSHARPVAKTLHPEAGRQRHAA
jgi:phosphatidylserine/phosphatidylglycerophosphate/cardiolipin synthase-like enzyme